MENEDWSEPLIMAKSLLRQVEDQSNMRNYDRAAKLVTEIQDELICLKASLDQMQRTKH